MADFNKDSLSNTFIVALGVCLVCSIVVSGIAVALKPTQQLNKELDQKQNILRAAGLLPQGSTTDSEGRSVEVLLSCRSCESVDGFAEINAVLDILRCLNRLPGGLQTHQAHLL